MYATSSRILLIAVIVLLSTIQASTVHPSTAVTSLSAEPGDGSLLFIENVGQFNERARFQVRGIPGTIWVTEDALWITRIAALERTDVQTHQRADLQLAYLKLSFPGADLSPNSKRRPHLEPFGPSETLINYYLGQDPANWYSEVPVWHGVRYVDLYPGVDLEVTGESGQLAWQLVGKAGCQVDLSEVTLRVEGADDLTVDDNAVHMSAAASDITLPLLTVYGGAPENQPAIARVTGTTFDIVAPFSPNPLIPPSSASQDNPGALLASMFIGGDNFDGAQAITLDKDGAIYATGYSGSTDTYWPQSPGVYAWDDVAPQDGHVGPIFVAKFGADLSDRNYMTFVGDEYQDYNSGITEKGTDIAVDGKGNVYITGQTMSLDEFPVTSGAFDTDLNNGVDENCPIGRTDRPCPDAFVVKLNASGQLDYATYLGGSYLYLPGGSENYGGSDYGVAIGVDKNNHVYIFGETNSQDFPTTSGAFDRTFSYEPIGLNTDIFVVKLDPAGNGDADLLYGTYLGSGFVNSAGDMVVDDDGIVHATGSVEGRATIVNGPKIDFPTTPGAYPRTSQCLAYNCSDLFFFKLNPIGQGQDDLLYGTLFGGTAPGSEYFEVEGGLGVARDESGAVYLVGETETPDYPTTPGAFMADYPGGTESAVVSKLDPAGNGADDLVYSTYLGGVYADHGAAVTVDGNGYVYVMGQTNSDNFPVTSDAYDATHNGTQDAFVTCLNPAESDQNTLVYSTYFGGSDAEYSEDIALAEVGIVYVTGSTSSWADFPITSGAYDTSFGGLYDGFVSSLAAPPTADLSASTKTVDPDEATAGQVVTFTARLVNNGDLGTDVAFTDTLPSTLLLQSSPSASSGSAPTVSDQTLTWSGTVTHRATVTITYATLLTSTTSITPTAVNKAYIDDGVGNVYVRRAFVNGHEVFLPVILK
jgi:uncharacterized repeat protein (TIGR01451 family)